MARRQPAPSQKQRTGGGPVARQVRKEADGLAFALPGHLTSKETETRKMNYHRSHSKFMGKPGATPVSGRCCHPTTAQTRNPSFTVAPHPNLRSRKLRADVRGSGGEASLGGLVRVLSLYHPSITYSQRPTELGCLGGGVGEIPCIRKLDTEFRYIGILYIC